MRVQSFMKFIRCLALLLAALLTGNAAVQGQTPPRKSNIVVILTDDLDALLGTTSYTPNINRLVRDAGIDFRQAFVTNALCCPSRSTLLRGQYTHSHQVYTNRPPTGGYQKFLALGHDSSTIATWLAQAGYATALLGKYLNGYPGAAPSYVPPGWSDWHVAAGGNAYGNYDYRLNENGRLRSYGHAPEDYLTDVLRTRALDFIRRSAAAKRPFYLEVATFAPHGPSTPAPRHAGMFAELAVPRTPAYDPPNARIPARLDRQYRLRVQSMQAVDELVAAVIAALRDAQLLDNTYIFFTSDNGFHMGQHGLGAGKSTAYEEDIRVPLFVRGPGISARSTSDALVANIDLAPTFAQIAGVAAPAFVEGRSLLPLLEGAPPARWRDGVLIESYDGGGPDTRPIRARATVDARLQQPRYTAIRTADMIYIEYRDGRRQLFDLHSDASELRNLADQKPEDVQVLSAWLHRLNACRGATCREADRR